MILIKNNISLIERGHRFYDYPFHLLSFGGILDIEVVGENCIDKEQSVFYNTNLSPVWDKSEHFWDKIF